jgi:hypothetical protein
MTSAGPIREFPLPNMKTPRHFEKLSTSAGLLVLGAGFVSLGALSFIKRDLEDAESGLLNSAYPIIGSLISILLGFTFFAIALLFMATRLKEEKAPRKVGRAGDPQRNPIGESLIDNAARSRHGDWFRPEVAFCEHKGRRERLVLVSDEAIYEPRVRPAIPVVEMTPAGTARPKLLVSCLVEICLSASCFSSHGICHRIDADRFHRREVDHQSMITDAESSTVVASVANGDREVLVAGEIDCCPDVCDIRAANDKVRAPIDHFIVHLVSDSYSMLAGVITLPWEIC